MELTNIRLLIYLFTISVTLLDTVDCVGMDFADHAVKLHRGKSYGQPSASEEFNKWLPQSCRNLETLLIGKRTVVKKLDRAIREVEFNPKLSHQEKAFQMHIFHIFQKELNETEISIFQSVNSLKRALKGDYKDIINMKESTSQRLDALREATLKEEQEYNDLLVAEKHQLEYYEHLRHLNMSNTNRTKVEAMLDSVLDEVAQAADILENQLMENVFDESRRSKSAVIEAVLRINEDGIKQNRTLKSLNEADQGMSVLIDANNNQYGWVTKPKDTTIPHEDHHFKQDIILMIVLSFLCGWVCHSLDLPSMFGYIMAGVILGSSGFNIIKAQVQVETLGEFGVFFILFMVGLEFSPDRIRKVWRVAVFGSVAMTILMMVCGLMFGYMLKIIPSQSVFVAACLSLSSTPLVVKFLGSQEKDTGQGDSEYSSTLLGILVVQDVQLGLLIAILPAMAGSPIPTMLPHQGMNIMDILRTLWLLIKLVTAMAFVLALSVATSKYVVPPFFHKLRQHGCREMLVLGSMSLAFIMLMVTDLLGISMELGCFLSGVIISSHSHGTVAEEISILTEPVRDVFACLFFASIGLHVFPTFVAYEFTVLLTLTFTVVIIKFVTGVFVLSVLLPVGGSNIKWIVAAGLAQVSEFSFVLGSRARRLGMLSREVYLLILSITTLSLLLAPVLWKISLWRCGRRKQHRGGMMR
uniref:Transmembrane and coiled-coil domain-containing protein 3-like n=1 Tax=Saccoglossus kowalevskii TaxID=10224 RepID=A0ABM0GY09_SACKO|nr:PREDICTED: transmembrane and coiled-coil domain-containing protein 3-like [Saccoglossus kowalevskii]